MAAQRCRRLLGQGMGRCCHALALPAVLGSPCSSASLAGALSEARTSAAAAGGWPLPAPGADSRAGGSAAAAEKPG